MDRDAGPGGSLAAGLLERIWDGLGGAADHPSVRLDGRGSVPSAFAASDLAQASIAAAGLALAELDEALAAAGLALAELDEARATRPGEVRVDRALASAWFVASYRPLGWSPPPAWDPLSADYRSDDGWIRLHTNAPHHRKAALEVLGVPPEPEAVAAAVGKWSADDLEDAVVRNGGAAAAMRSVKQWALHPQGAAVAAEPILHRSEFRQPVGGSNQARRPWWERAAGGSREPDRPLAGLRVLDLTRVLAGPVATRFLAGWGAEVLRIDPPDWDEPPLEPDVTVGKRCARMDLRDPASRDRLLELLASADVMVHGYRPGALEHLGLGEDVRRQVQPGLVDVSLDAYGWSGPWAGRRGFDSLVQMSSGIADAGKETEGADRPRPLPFQALDHGTGYLLAAAALRGLTLAVRDGVATSWRTSLARTAALLVAAGPPEVGGGADRSQALDPRAIDLDPAAPHEKTVWGDLVRLPSPLEVGGRRLAWNTPARPLGTDQAAW